MPKRTTKKTKKEFINEEIYSLAMKFLMHEKPFTEGEYQSFYDRYKKYIDKEPGAEHEHIISMLADYQGKTFTNEAVKDKLALELVKKYEAAYEKDDKDIDAGLPDALHRIKKKHLRLLISKHISDYFKGFTYDQLPHPDHDPRSIVFSKNERNCKLALDFDMGVYGAGVWVSISVGIIKPLILVNLGRYMSYELISYNNLEEAEDKIQHILKLLSLIGTPFLDAIRDGVKLSREKPE